jgi:hypothetical protein
MSLPAALKPGDKLGSVITFKDIYGERSWLRIGTEHFHCTSIVVYQQGDALWIRAVMNRGDAISVNLDDVAQATLYDNSIWKALRERPGVHAHEILRPERYRPIPKDRWDSQRPAALIVIVLGVILAMGTIVFGTLTNWTFHMELPAPDWFVRLYAQKW